jgi:hypothetical protein
MIDKKASRWVELQILHWHTWKTIPNDPVPTTRSAM